MHVCAYLAILFLYCDNKKTHLCGPMIKLCKDQILNTFLQENKYKEINEKHIRIHVYEYIASALLHRDRKPKYISIFLTKKKIERNIQKCFKFIYYHRLSKAL